MTYQINIENTGLDTDEQVDSMAELLRDRGYSVEATRTFGAINGGNESPFEGGAALADWEECLIAASNA